MPDCLQAAAPVTFILLGIAFPASADPMPAVPTQILDVEIVEKPSGGKPESLLSTLALVGEHDCATFESRRAGVSHELEICRVAGDADGVTLSTRLERSTSSDRYSGAKKLRSTVRVARGKRVAVARLEHPDGAATEVLLTAR